MKPQYFYNKADLGRSMPANLPNQITAGEHNQSFYALMSADIWTADGWLITAVEKDGETYRHHMRQGTTVRIAKLPASDIFSYAPTEQTAIYGFK